MTTPREEFDQLAARLAAETRLPPPEHRRALRQRRGVSLRAAARTIGVSPTAVAAWETGRYRPCGQHLAGYLDLLDLLARPEAAEA